MASAASGRGRRRPGLTVVLVGEHPASMAYVRGKEKAARDAGMTSEVLRLPRDRGRGGDPRRRSGRLNADPRVHGILVQLPLPTGVDASRVLEAIDPAKDVDGFHPINAGRLLLGLPGVLPCTPAGVDRAPEAARDPARRKARGRAWAAATSSGKPMAILLLRENCTVTIAHSRTARPRRDRRRGGRPGRGDRAAGVRARRRSSSPARSSWTSASTR